MLRDVFRCCGKYFRKKYLFSIMHGIVGTGNVMEYIFRIKQFFQLNLLSSLSLSLPFHFTKFLMKLFQPTIPISSKIHKKWWRGCRWNEITNPSCYLVKVAFHTNYRSPSSGVLQALRKMLTFLSALGTSSTILRWNLTKQNVLYLPGIKYLMFSGQYRYNGRKEA